MNNQLINELQFHECIFTFKFYDSQMHIKKYNLYALPDAHSQKYSSQIQNTNHKHKVHSFHNFYIWELFVFANHHVYLWIAFDSQKNKPARLIKIKTKS